MNRLLLIACLPLLAFSCGEEEYEGPDIDFGPGKGITYRNNRGYLSGVQDSTDWISDMTWSQQEQYGFAYRVPNLNGPQLLGSVRSISAYPNPTPNGVFVMRLRLNPTAPCPCKVTVSVVSKRYYEIALLEQVAAAGDSVVFRPTLYNNGESYRLRYLVTNLNGLLYKGHGDILYK